MEPRLAMNDPPASAFGMQGLQACKTAFQPFISCLQPCFLAERRGILNVGRTRRPGEKNLWRQKSERAAELRTAGSTICKVRQKCHSVGTSDGRQNQEQALHCYIMSCGLRRLLASSSL